MLRTKGESTGREAGGSGCLWDIFMKMHSEKQGAGVLEPWERVNWRCGTWGDSTLREVVEWKRMGPKAEPWWHQHQRPRKTVKQWRVLVGPSIVASVLGAGVCGASLCPPLNVAENLKLLYRNVYYDEWGNVENQERAAPQESRQQRMALESL